MTARSTDLPAARLWRAPWLLLVLPPLFWSGNFVIGRAMNEALPPVGLAFWRWVAAFLILLPFVARPLWRSRRAVCAHWRLLLALGALGMAGYNTFVYLALQTVPTANAAVMNSIVPVLIPFVAWAVARERVNAAQVTGIALSLAGALWIVAQGDLATLGTLAVRPGDLWMLLAVVDWALYSVLLRYKPAELAPAVFMAVMVLFGIAVLAPFWLWERASGATMPATPGAVASVLYIALFASVLAFIFWNRAVALLGATASGLSIHLMPVFATLLAFLVLGEPVRGFHLVGAALIVVGLTTATALGRRGSR